MSDFEAELSVGKEQEANLTSFNRNCVDLQAGQPLQHWHIRDLPRQGLFGMFKPQVGRPGLTVISGRSPCPAYWSIATTSL